MGDAVKNSKKWLFGDSNNKYNAKRSNGFASRKEERDYNYLLIRQRAGEISDLQTQVTFELVPKMNGERSIKYVADFVFKEGDKTVVQDSKGYRTREYIMKRKIFKWRYPEFEFRES